MFFFLMIRRPPRSTLDRSSAASDVYKRQDNDYARTQSRIEISKSVFSKYAGVRECYSKGKSQVERSIYLIHLTDWVSVLLAEKKQIDATEVNIINHLKGELSKI